MLLTVQIKDIKSLTILTELEDLNVSNTHIEDVYELWKLKKLTKINCAGTQIKKLDALEKIENLTYLNCSNTNISKLSALNNLPLLTLKCFNTKIPNRVIENFKASHLSVMWFITDKVKNDIDFAYRVKKEGCLKSQLKLKCHSGLLSRNPILPLKSGIAGQGPR